MTSYYQINHIFPRELYSFEDKPYYKQSIKLKIAEAFEVIFNPLNAVTIIYRVNPVRVN